MTHRNYNRGYFHKFSYFANRLFEETGPWTKDDAGVWFSQHGTLFPCLWHHILYVDCGIEFSQTYNNDAGLRLVSIQLALVTSWWTTGWLEIEKLCWHWHIFQHEIFNSSPPGQNGRYFADYIFRCIFLNETFCILIKISFTFVPKGPINNNPEFI